MLFLRDAVSTQTGGGGLGWATQRRRGWRLDGLTRAG
jgi:hypothetical protein